MMLFLRKLKRVLNGSLIDKTIRYIFNYIYMTKNYLSLSSNDKEINNIALFSYGGMGDNLLCFPLIKKLSEISNIYIFVEEKFLDLIHLLPDNCLIIPYTKKNIFSTLYAFRKKKIKNLLFIQQSPIFELVLFKTIIKAEYSIGFIFSHTKLSSINLPQVLYKKKIYNKVNGYDLLFTEISNFLGKKTSYKKIMINEIKSIPKKFNLTSKFFIISVTKDPQWEMGGFEPNAYAEAINYIYKQKKLIPVFVGTKHDKLRVNQVLKVIQPSVEFINLTGQTKIKELISIVQKCTFIMANDNGIHHLSNFLNKPTLTLFNFSSAKVYDWHNKDSFVLYKNKYKCMPCVSKPLGPWDNIPFKCPYNIQCKNSLKANDIIRKIDNCLN